MPVAIRPERPNEVAAVQQLHHDAFGEERVAQLAAVLRQAPAPLAPISLVAVDVAGVVIGHVLLSHARLDAPQRLVDVLTLSPLAVAASHRRQGLGGRLIAAGLATADARGVPLVFLEGDPGYYVRYGFVAAEPLGFRRPSLRIPEPAFQVARLAGHAPRMTGSFIYSEPFWALDCVGLR